jgi:hypothetical protein
VLNKGQEISLFVEVNERIIDNTLNADEAVNPRAHVLIDLLGEKDRSS